jgi:prepilin-type N-terminal cleavage/methylation domain-containing protein/prepilin-type processing-associated H-X9-DG protein
MRRSHAMRMKLEDHGTIMQPNSHATVHGLYLPRGGARRESRFRRPLHGFTLVELLVVITIIGILIALLLPAVQAAREAARRMQCCNNLKQLALALHNYHASHETLPAGSYCAAPQGDSSIYGCHNWLEGLLPFMEQQPLYDQIKFKVDVGANPNLALFTNLVIPGLMCPTDPAAGMQDRSAVIPPPRPVVAKSLGESYAPNGGPMNMGSANCTVPAWTAGATAPENNGRNCYPDWGGTGGMSVVPTPRGMSHGLFAPGWGVSYRFSDCQDGLSNTLLLGEQLPGYVLHGLYFHSHMIAATTNVPPNYHLIMNCPEAAVMTTAPSDACHDAMAGFKSKHPGGLNLAMADGSVSFVNETINYATWVFLGSRSDGVPVMLP